jgi:hypothetical protein
MSTFSAVFAALLLGAPLATLAQATNPAPTPRLYGGLAIYDGPNQSVSGLYSGQRFNLPVQATLGYQLQPRLALQVGLAYSSDKASYTNVSNYLDNRAALVNYQNNTVFLSRATSTSLLARYTLTRQASHRFQVDAVGGLSLDQSFYRNMVTETYISQGATEVTSKEYAGSYNSFCANLGPSLRYRFAERLEGVYDLLLGTSLFGRYYNLNASMALGLRYHFGKPS